MTGETTPLLPPTTHQPERYSSQAHLDTDIARARHQTRRYLSSKWGHYTVLLLVGLDVAGIFADFLLGLYICEHTCGKGHSVDPAFPRAQHALGIVSLVFSCLFMLELLASIWAFGRQFFHSWFRCFDGTVIVAGFIIDVCLSGVLEEVGSIVVVLRLWRVFKIIEEFSSGASEQMELLQNNIERLEQEKVRLKAELDSWTNHGGSRSGGSSWHQ